MVTEVKVARYIAGFLVEKGVTDVFMVTGGGAMHLDDALGHEPGLHCTFNHHEQACAIAAEGYARLTNRVAAVCVTSGPGGTNALTGVLGGWQDSIPMFVISGQVKRETTTACTGVPVRQLGDQEFQIVDVARTMTKYAVLVDDPDSIRYHLEKAWYLCNHGRKGPVWLDIPLDVQAAKVDAEALVGFDPSELADPEDPVYDESLTAAILDKLVSSHRPVIMVGAGVRLAGAQDRFLELADKLQVPVVTAWNAYDLLPDDNPWYCGRPATVGTRGGNFVVQSCDLIIVLGCRLNIRQVSYSHHVFASEAYKVVVDIDEAELYKPTVDVDLPVHADVNDVIASLLAAYYEGPTDQQRTWLSWARGVDRRYPATLPAYYDHRDPINPYVFINELSEELADDDKVICGNGSACVITFQAMRVKAHQRWFTNSGCAAMGYGFPAAIGCAVATPGARTICIDGDGSFQMNLQELQTVVYNRLDLKVFIINNAGYHSIRQTQTNSFQPPLVGVGEGSGLSFPDLSRIAWAYGIPYVRVQSLDTVHEDIRRALETTGPVLCEVVVDPEQRFEPKLSSKVLPDGSIVSPDIDDMYPFLPREEYEAVKRCE